MIPPPATAHRRPSDAVVPKICCYLGVGLGLLLSFDTRLAQMSFPLACFVLRAAPRLAQLAPARGRTKCIRHRSEVARASSITAIESAVSHSKRFTDVRMGDQVLGTVAKVVNNAAFVDIGASQLAELALEEIAKVKGPVEDARDVFRRGEAVEVWVQNKWNNGKVFLTLTDPMPTLRAFAQFPESKYLTCKINKVIAIAALVDVTLPDGGPTARGYLHVSQMASDIESVEGDFEVGQSVRVRILGVNWLSGQIKLSSAKLKGGELPGTRPEQDVTPFWEVSSDLWLVGEVLRAGRTIATVRVTAPDSELRADGDLRRSLMKSELDVLEVGQRVDVRAVRVDLRTGKMHLSTKDPREVVYGLPLADLWAFAALPPDELLYGKTIKYDTTGATLEVRTPNRKVSAFGHLPRDEIPDSFKAFLRQDLDVRVADVDFETGLLRFTMGPCGQISSHRSIDVSAFAGVSPKERLRGRVARVTSFGLFLEVRAPIGEAQADAFAAPEHVPGALDAFRVGQSVDVRLLSLGVEDGVLSVSLKPPVASVVEPFLDLDEKAVLVGRVTKLSSGGASVEVTAPGCDTPCEGYLPNFWIGDGNTLAEAALVVGQEVEVMIGVIDVSAGTLQFLMPS